MSAPVSLLFKGQATKHTTVKWSNLREIQSKSSVNFMVIRITYPTLLRGSDFLWFLFELLMTEKYTYILIYIEIHTDWKQ